MTEHIVVFTTAPTYFFQSSVTIALLTRILFLAIAHSFFIRMWGLYHRLWGFVKPVCTIFLKWLLTFVYICGILNYMRQLEFGVKIKKMRTKKGLSQEDLARSLNVSSQTVHRWETGKTKPSRLALQVLRNEGWI